MVLWRLEDVHGNTFHVAVFVSSVKEVKEELQPLENNVELLLGERALLGELVGQWRDEQ